MRVRQAVTGGLLALAAGSSLALLPRPIRGARVHTGRAVPPPMPAPGLWTAAPRDPQIEALEAIGYLGGTERAPAGGGVILHDPRAWEGLNLVCSGHAAEAWLMDMDGAILHRWSRPFESVWPDRVVDEARPEHQFWRRVHLLPSGELLAIFEGYGLIKLGWDSELIWAWDGGAHHDLEVAEDGLIWVLSRRGRYLPELGPEPILEDFVSVLSPGGQELRRISVLRAVLGSDARALYEGSRKKRGDIFHTNSLSLLRGRAPDPAFAAGRLLLSSRTLSAVMVLDPLTERVVWWRTGEFRQLHDPQILDDGSLLLFDNLGPTGERSAVRQYRLPGMDPIWRYEGGDEGPLFSRFLGTAQRLPNGNTLITASSPGRALEVTPAGERVWEYTNPHRAGEDGEYIAILPEVRRLPPSLELPL